MQLQVYLKFFPTFSKMFSMFSRYFFAKVSVYKLDRLSIPMAKINVLETEKEVTLK